MHADFLLTMLSGATAADHRSLAVLFQPGRHQLFPLGSLRSLQRAKPAPLLDRLRDLSLLQQAHLLLSPNLH